MNKPTHESYLALKERIEKIRKRKDLKVFYLDRLREVFSFVSDWTSAKLEQGLDQRAFYGKIDSSTGIDILSPQYLHPEYGEVVISSPVSQLCWGGYSKVLNYKITLGWIEGSSFWEFSISHRVNIDHVDLDRSLMEGTIIGDARNVHSLLDVAKYIIDLEEAATQEMKTT